MKRWWVNIGLLVVLIALGLVAWWHPGSTDNKPPPTTITTLKPADIHIIRIAQPGQKTAVFKRKNHAWRMVKPIAMRADNSTIRRWLASVDETSSRDYSTKGLDLSQFGLKPPKLSLTLNNQTLEFGSLAPIGHQRYIRRGDRVYLVTDRLYYQLQGNPLTFASKYLLPRNAKITALSMPGLALKQSDKGQWQLTPPQPKTTSDQIQKLIDHWSQAQALKVTAIKNAKTTGKITLRIQGRKTPITFQIRKNATQLVLARPDLDIQFMLPASQRAKLLQLAPAKKASGNAQTSSANAPVTPDKHPQTHALKTSPNA